MNNESTNHCIAVKLHAYYKKDNYTIHIQHNVDSLVVVLETSVGLACNVHIKGHSSQPSRNYC